MMMTKSKIQSLFEIIERLREMKISCTKILLISEITFVENFSKKFKVTPSKVFLEATVN